MMSEVLSRHSKCCFLHQVFEPTTELARDEVPPLAVLFTVRASRLARLSRLCQGWPAVLAPHPGGTCCFSFFFFLNPKICWFLTRPPNTHSHCNARENPDSPAEGIKKSVQYVISFGYCPARAWICHPTHPDVPPHLKPERRYPPATGLQYSYPVPQLVSRLRSRNLEGHDVWQRCFFVSYSRYTSTYLVHAYYHQLFLLLSVTRSMYLPARPTIVCYTFENMYVLLHYSSN